MVIYQYNVISATLVIACLMYGVAFNEVDIALTAAAFASLLPVILFYYRSRKLDFSMQFAILNCLFLGSRFILHVVSDNFTIAECFLFTRTIISQQNLFAMAIIYSSACISMLFAGGIMLHRRERAVHTFSFSLRLLRGLMILLSILLAYNTVSIAHALYTYGYVAFFSDTSNYLNSGIYPHHVLRVSYLVISAYLFCRPSKLDTLFVCFVILVGICGSATGQRAPIFLAILFLLWYYDVYHSRKVNVVKLFLFALALMVIGQYMITLRSGYEYSLIEIPLQFLNLNGVSICTLAYVLEFPSITSEHSYHYFIAPITDYLDRTLGGLREVFYSDRSYDLLQVSDYLSYHMTYTVNPEAFFAGYGTGTSYLAELYAWRGLWSVTAITFLLVIILRIIDNNIFYSRYVVALVPLVIYQLVYSPRDAVLKFVDHLTLLTFTIAIVLLIETISARIGRIK